MALGTVVEVDGSHLARAVYELERRARGLGRKMPQVAEILVAAVDDVYEAEGPNWEPLAASTMRRRRGSTARILQDTGVMAASTTGRSGPDWAEASAGVGYAKYHASGGKNLPQRNPFDLGPFEDAVLEEIAELLAAEVTG